MQITKVKTVEREALVEMECDKCKRRFDGEDFVDLQDFVSARDTGGYGSAWGDGCQWSIDLCGPCAVELLGAYAHRHNIER